MDGVEVGAWKVEKAGSWGKGAGGEMVRNFLAKLHSNYFRAVVVGLHGWRE